MTNTNGELTRNYNYDAFGNEREPDEDDTNPFRYCGEYYDTETGLYYLRARYYDPLIGRFTQEDTHWNTANMIYGDNPQKINERKDALGLKTYSYAPQLLSILQAGNLYVYCVSNPISYQDPEGKALINVVFAAIFAIAGWFFGDYVAKKLDLSGWKYWTVRAAVTASSAVIGWAAGVAITKIAAGFLIANPDTMLSLASKLGPSTFSAAMKFLGIDPFTLINSSGKFHGLLQNVFNTPTVQIGLDWAKSLIQKAQQFGIPIRLDGPHNNNWNVWHLNVGKYHVAILSTIVDAVRELLGGG